MRSGHRVGSRGCKGGGDDESDERYENNKGEEGEDGTKLDRERYASFYFRAYIKLTKSKKNDKLAQNYKIFGDCLPRGVIFYN